MGHPVFVKICGITTEKTLSLVIEQGARFAGFVLVPGSVRNLSLRRAQSLLENFDNAPQICRVALLVNPDDDILKRVCQAKCFDAIQLHGNETPDMVRRWRKCFDFGWIKAVPIGSYDDLMDVNKWKGVADHILLDTKPPKNAVVPGGHGLAWNWSLLQNLNQFEMPPLILAGGLTAENVATAIKETCVSYVDVSSGVESQPGVKDHQKIKALFSAIRNTDLTSRPANV